MCASLLRNFFLAVRATVLTSFLCLGAVRQGYGQRVYADAQESSPTLSLLVTLSEVANPSRAVDSDTLNYSTLSVTLGALGAIVANQNLRYINNPKPTIHTPVMVKFGSTSSLLNLLGGFSVQRTNGGRTSVIAPAYSGSQLLNLLNLFGSSQTGIAIIPPNGQPFDGVRLEVNTTLGGLLTGFYYYAFYITPPQTSQSTLTLCGNSTGTLTITNFQPGYTYRLYDQQIGGMEVGQATTSSTLTIPGSLAAGTYWLEARESDTYPSARTAITVAVNPPPEITLSPIPPICEGETTAALPYTNATNDPDQYSIVWNTGTPGDFININDGAISSSPLAIPIPATAKMGTYSGILTVRNRITGCQSEGMPFTVEVLPSPGRPHLTITDIQN